MTGKVHLATGFAAGLIGSFLLYGALEPVLYYTVGCSVGSIFPDIDNPKSMISKPLPAISNTINHWFGHRTITHAPIFLLLFMITLQSRKLQISDMSYALLYGFAAGIFSHFMQDMCTTGGVPILYPFYKKRTSLCKVRSGNASNIPISICLLILWIIGIRYYTKLPERTITDQILILLDRLQNVCAALVAVISG